MNPFVWFGMMVAGLVMCLVGVLHGGPALALCGTALFVVGTAKLTLWEPPGTRSVGRVRCRAPGVRGMIPVFSFPVLTMAALCMSGALFTAAHYHTEHTHNLTIIAAIAGIAAGPVFGLEWSRRDAWKKSTFLNRLMEDRS